MSSLQDPRVVAVSVITEVLQKKIPLNTVLQTYKQKCAKTDQGFLQALCFGTLRWYPRLKYFVNKLLEHPLKSKDLDLMNLLCMGIFQLEKMRTPDHAAVSTTVETARKLNKTWAVKLVNAVLRNFLRQKDTLQSEIKNNEEAFTAHPAWLLHEIKKDWPKDWVAIIEENNAAPPLSLRINKLQNTREQYLQKLKMQGIEAHPISGTDFGIIIESPTDVLSLPGFLQGEFSVQDGAAQLAMDLLMPEPGVRVLDCCSAPGGKLTHLLETVQNIEVTAVDISKDRIDLIHDNLKRLRLNAIVLQADANQIETWWDKKLFDRILCDASCSATGVIRRHPEIKLLRTKEDIVRGAQEQLKLLEAVWPILKNNGILLYATCSILAAENENVINKFLSLHKDAKIEPIELSVGKTLELGHQILPGQNEMDGFYYARLRKTQ